MPGQAATAKRKLAAILHADVVGYSRLMGEDEVGTHARLMAHRKTIDDIISRHSGRVVGTAGDAVLADFPSVVEAISAAVDIQEALAGRNAAVPNDLRLEFRIGINLGDVIVDGDDIFGDGVNVAARLESLADPGGIAVSGAVYDQVKNKLDLTFRDRGTHRVKNIAEPVRVYAVGSPGGRAPLSRLQPSRRFAIVGTVAFFFAFAGVFLFRMLPLTDGSGDKVGPRISKDTPSNPAASTGKPTIAVLPFEDRNGDATQAYFVDGITEDVITDLGRFSNLLVLSWNAVAPYKSQTVALERLSRDLDVRYVVAGTVRRGDNRLRITVQLTDARRGVLLWSERFDKGLEDIFAVQDQIVRQVVRALALRLTHFEQERAFEKPTDKLDAYDRVLRGRALLRRVDRSANSDARAMFEQAKKIDPRYVDAYVGLGWSHMKDFWFGWTEWPDRAIGQAQDLAGHALRLDDRNASAHALLADVLTYQNQYDRAEREVDRAIELNPNYAMSHGIRGSMMMWSGRLDSAVSSLELALRLDPHPLAMWLVNLGQAYYFLGRYDDTVRLLNRFKQEFEEDPAPYAVLAASYAQLGRHEAAAQAVATLRRNSPFFDAVAYASHFSNPAHGKHLLDGLAKAGFKAVAR